VGVNTARGDVAVDVRLDKIQLGFGVTMLNRCLFKGPVDGIGRYTIELLKALAKREDVELSPISFGIAMHDDVPNKKQSKVLAPYKQNALISLLTKRPFIGSQKLTTKLDLLHATDHLIPNTGRLPVVATIMDAIPLVHPEWVSKSLMRPIKNELWRRSASWSDHIITISDYSKKKIIDHFRVDEKKISVVPLGVNNIWFEKISENKINQVLEKFSLPKNYFIFVGTLQPRKNIDRLITAYCNLPAYLKNELGLIIVGGHGWKSEKLISGLKTGIHGHNIRWLASLSDSDLVALTKNATALVFPSLCEGFGLPVLEAFAAGTPVVTSNTTSLLEVAEDAALLVNPLDVQAITNAMLKIAEDDNLANRLRLLGRSRAREFSWDRCARETIAVYQKVMAL
jgi:glycosyltransferase involved in cell wall biosynthesis